MWRDFCAQSKQREVDFLENRRDFRRNFAHFVGYWKEDTEYFSNWRASKSFRILGMSLYTSLISKVDRDIAASVTAIVVGVLSTRSWKNLK